MPASVPLIYEDPDISEHEHARSLLDDALPVEHPPESERLAVKARYDLETEDLLSDARGLRIEYEFHYHICQQKKKYYHHHGC